MNLLIFLCLSILKAVVSNDVCVDNVCQCSESATNVNCDAKGWTTLSAANFPSKVVTLTLVNNRLRFDTIDDRSKIENLTSLLKLSLNENPLGTIPPFDTKNIQSLSLQDTSLKSARFPPSYQSSILQRIFLSYNEIPSIDEDDFLALKSSTLKKLDIDYVGLTTIYQNAFAPLSKLQALSLKNNYLKSSEFLATLPLLSSIQLDGNQFTSLPQQLSSPQNIKTFSFTNNHISSIDESSPLSHWKKMNYTNVKIYLANNSFDCCQSLWFIRFLNTSVRFIADASLLTCATPAMYAGRQLIHLYADELQCGGNLPSDSWWTNGRILAVTCGGLAAVLAASFTVLSILRCRPVRSGYTEIDGIDQATASAPLAQSDELPFPSYNNTDDNASIYSTIVSRSMNGSEAPTTMT